ncbi:MAG: hypothetical protein NDJ89_05980 [Oligoflexia bacterium]|nr:hypothetical protein [Oligoflexia bacterium]
MKRFLAVLGMAVFSINASADTLILPTITPEMISAMNTVAPMNLINWKVGDQATFDVSAGAFGKLGKMVKEVTREEGNAIWIHQNIDLGFQKDVSDILMSRADGKILKFIHNGKEEAIPNDKVEIISQDATEITVPAGTFQVIHVVAKTQKISKIEVWANPRDTVMEGTVKQFVATGLLDLTMELLNFKRGQ